MQNVLDDSIGQWIDKAADDLENILDAQVITYYGAIYPAITKPFRNFIEQIAQLDSKKDRLCIFIQSAGGSVETVEKLVNVIRHHYKEVWFFVPDMAMSAGTIFCMSGDKIYMDYSSSLGPIDPQIFNGQYWVPALGYLDKVEELVSKSRKGQLADAEMIFLQNQDLAQLRLYEQARDLSVELLKLWLATYKFKDWAIHRTDALKIGSNVTADEKRQRASEIAGMLSDNKLWHSHGRMIGLDTLRDKLRLEIDDYSNNKILTSSVRWYHDMLTDYVDRQRLQSYLHHKEIKL
ncbi:MAG: ATP-dependent Clp protease proteolytic subunit [Rickettsiales bacterium]